MIEPAYRAILLDNSVVTDITADRIWLKNRPQDERRPGVVITLTSTEHPHTYEGHGGYVNGVIQCDCLAPDYKTAKALAAAVIDAIDSFTGTVNDLPIDWIEVDSEQDIQTVPLEGRALPTFGISIDTSFQYQR